MALVVSQCPVFNIIQAVDVAANVVAEPVPKLWNILGAPGELVQPGLVDHGMHCEAVVDIDEKGLSLKQKKSGKIIKLHDYHMITSAEVKRQIK